MPTAHRRSALLPALLPLALCLLAPACDGGKTPAKEPPASGAAPADKAAADGSAPTAEPTAHADPADGGEKVKLVEGAPGGDDRFAVQIEPPADAKAGQAGTAVVKVVPKAPWHMNLDYPTSMQLTAPDGLAVAKADFKKGDAQLDESHCQFDVQFTPAAAGEHAVSGTIKFAVCKDEACSPVTQDVAFNVAVN